MNEPSPLAILAVRLPRRLEARLYLCGAPGVHIQPDGSLTLDEEALAREMQRLRRRGVRLLIGLVEDDELFPVAYEDIAAAAAALRIRSVRFPIADYQSPRPDQEPIWADIHEQILGAFRQGHAVAFHCLAGVGRSGTMAARFLIGLGLDPRSAVATVEMALPGGLESAAQIEYLYTRVRNDSRDEA